MERRRVQVFAALVLVTAAFGVFHRVYVFGQERFFTVDEYQYGHATWLVSEGQRPYLDFYEHHFPLSYVAHAPLLWLDDDFEGRALGLRKIVFAYILGASLLLGYATYRVTGDVCGALLAVMLPASGGFGLMSAVDYRADNFGAFLLLGALGLMEANRARAGGAARWVAGACGVMLALSVFSTQKMVFLAGLSVALLVGIDAVGRLRSRRAPPLVVHPAALCLGAGAVTLCVLGVGAAFGMLGVAWEITIFQALQHEAFYPAVSWREYALPFYRATPATTSLFVALAVAYFALPARGAHARRVFWAVPLGVALVGGALVKAQYPYNYVLLSAIVGLCAARGAAAAIALASDRLEPRSLGRVAPLLYLLPLGLLPAQLGFVAHTTSNAHQLGVLSKIERFSTEADAVIDNAGGALFRPHGSYYFQHGKAHRAMFEGYFQVQLEDDYRRSEALLWLIDYRLLDLPKSVHEYFLHHYVRVDGSLFALGFHTPRSYEGKLVMDIDVVRSGDYHVFPAPVKLSRQPLGTQRRDRDFDLIVDGEPVSGDAVRLERGPHRVTILPGSPGYYVTLVSPDAFLLDASDRFWRELMGAKAHQLLFEYDPGATGG